MDVRAAEPPAAAPTSGRRVSSSGQLSWWELAALSAGVAASVAAVVVTLRADFLAYPGWLAIQKADLILGPIGVGVYWHRRRPRSRFGPLLIALGFLHVPYILQSSSNSVLFTLAVHWEGAIYLATLAIILVFPTGRFTWPDWTILGAAALGVVLPNSLLTLFSPQITAGGSISACRAGCPDNALLISVDPKWITRLFDIDRAAIIAVATATAGLLIWRFARGTLPQRRALAIGTPIALLFLVTQGLFQATNWIGYTNIDFNTYLRWLFVIARAALWYGFLFALIAAQFFAADVLRRMIRESLQRPSLADLEALLREPLGDRRLQLAFRERGGDAWIDGEGNLVEPPGLRSRRVLTEVDYDGRPAAAIVHDAQLADDPELIEAAASTALLAFENAQLQTAWSKSVSDLRDSRARLAAASDRERRIIERDLHDGPQQALVALSVQLALAAEGTADAELRRRLSDFGEDLDHAIEELRDLAHGIYPSALVDLGLVPSLRSVAAHAGRNIDVSGDGVGRYPAELESALYYCCREALQNALKHAGSRASISIQLSDGNEELRFEVRDDGTGFDPAAPRHGSGLRNMEDRIGALDGIIRFVSAPGQGTVVFGSVPLRS